MDDNRTTAERLRALIEEMNIPYIELERLSGVPKSAIQRYASGVTKKIPLDRIFRIADALGVSPYDLAGSDRPWGSADLGQEYAKRDFLGNPLPSDDLPSNIQPISALHRQRVPLIGAVAAGEPIYDPEELGVYVDSVVDADAAITVRGDSMAPTYLDGDVVYIKCRPDVPEGVVAVVFLDDEAAIKHVYKRPTGLTLWSDNPSHLPMQIEFADYANVRIFGVPVGYTRIYKKGIEGKIKKGFTGGRT